MDAADRIEIHELPGRYGDAIDDRDWDRLGRVFTEDATFDLTSVGGPNLQGLESIKSFMDTEAAHPLTHTMTNIYVDETPEGVMLHFRILALRRDEPVGTGSYHDRVVKTPDGWRVQQRVFQVGRRRPVNKG